MYDSSEITTSFITVRWTPPYLDPNLVQSYSVSLRGHQDSNYYDSASVHLQTSYMYTFYSSFIPSFNYYLEITSNILLSDPEETFSVKTGPFTLHVIVGKTFINVSIYLIFYNLINDQLRMCPLYSYFFPNSKSSNNSSLKKMMKCVFDNIWHTYLFIYNRSTTPRTYWPNCKQFSSADTSSELVKISVQL